MKHILTVIESRLYGVVLAAATVADAVTGSHLAHSGGVDWTVFASALASLGLSVKEEMRWAAKEIATNQSLTKSAAPAPPSEPAK